MSEVVCQPVTWVYSLASSVNVLDIRDCHSKALKTNVKNVRTLYYGCLLFRRGPMIFIPIAIALCRGDTLSMGCYAFENLTVMTWIAAHSYEKMMTCGKKFLRNILSCVPANAYTVVLQILQFVRPTKGLLLHYSAYDLRANFPDTRKLYRHVCIVLNKPYTGIPG